MTKPGGVECVHVQGRRSDETRHEKEMAYMRFGIRFEGGQLVGGLTGWVFPKK
jgi:hypothetical protein